MFYYCSEVIRVYASQLVAWSSGIEHWSLADVLSLSCARLLAAG